ncbi:hypothetical protein BGP_4871 [Beggiatoa sp. PS]|nr:hypothetical protein BGP_4871 [Beggiatoa sp. PS]
MSLFYHNVSLRYYFFAKKKFWTPTIVFEEFKRSNERSEIKFILDDKGRTALRYFFSPFVNGEFVKNLNNIKE